MPKGLQGFQKGNKLGRKFTHGQTKEMIEKRRETIRRRYQGNWVGGYQKGHIGYKAMLGKHLSEEAKEKISEKKKGIRVSPRTEFKRGQIPWNFKGGNHNFRHQETSKWYYKVWRKAVFERNNYTCQFCRKLGNGDLHADHIKPWSKYPELRFDVDNGRTLCIPCHKTTETYPQNLLRSPI